MNTQSLDVKFLRDESALLALMKEAFPYQNFSTLAVSCWHLWVRTDKAALAACGMKGDVMYGTPDVQIVRYVPTSAPVGEDGLSVEPAYVRYDALGTCGWVATQGSVAIGKAWERMIPVACAA